MSAAGGRITAGAGANLLGQNHHDRNQDATCYVGNLERQVTEEILWEIFVQAGPLVNVYLPKDRITGAHQGYGFVEFKGEQDADYAMKIFNMLKLYGMPIKVNKSSQDKGFADVGANLFVGNLDGEVDEKYLYDTFSAFGMVTKTPKVARDPDTGESRGFGFVSFRTFEASDAAIEAMNGQFLYNRPVTVSYAFKKDSRGERHGTPAERLLAHKNRGLGEQRPHTMFAAGPGQVTPGHQGGGMPPPPMPPGGVFPPGGLLPGMHMPPPPMGMGGGYMRPPPPPMMYTNGGPPPPPPMNIHLPPGMQMQPMQPPPPPPPM